MSIPIYEDEVTVDKDGTVRLKKDGRILEQNGVWLARNYYPTTREAERAEQESVQRVEDAKMNKAAEKEASILGTNKDTKPTFRAGGAKIKNSWWEKLKSLVSSHQATK